MSPIACWAATLTAGILLSLGFGDVAEVSSTIAAWALVYGVWKFSSLRFVASRNGVAKMSSALITRHLRLTVRRLLSTAALALVLYLAAWPHWGVVYWLSVAVYYQVGVALAIYDAWHYLSASSGSTTRA